MLHLLQTKQVTLTAQFIKLGPGKCFWIMGQSTNGPPEFDYLGPIPHKHSKCTPEVSYVGEHDYLARFDEGTNESRNEKGVISNVKMTKG